MFIMSMKDVYADIWSCFEFYFQTMSMSIVVGSHFGDFTA